MGARVDALLFALLVLIGAGGCGGTEDACPAGLIRREGRCVTTGGGGDGGAHDAGARDAASGDAAVDCGSGREVGADCGDVTDCPCGPCLLLADGRHACSSGCTEEVGCLEGWACGAGGLCDCAPVDETCNGRDDDCDGAIDDDAPDASVWFVDGDGDGFGDPDDSVVAYEQPEGTAAAGGDCDDAVAARHPGAEEVCDGLDDDCDQFVPSDESDVDDGGYGICEGDCADEDRSRNPGVAEACNGVDDDCDGAVPPEEADGDHDGFRICEGDCADGDVTRNPGAAEACNGLDDDCNGAVPANEADGDEDGFRICAGDCLDKNPDVRPNQNGWFVSDRGDGSYDYNCDGDETQRWVGASCRPQSVGCTTDHWCNSTPECGQQQYRGVCIACGMQCDIEASEWQNCR